MYKLLIPLVLGSAFVLTYGSNYVVVNGQLIDDGGGIWSGRYCFLPTGPCLFYDGGLWLGDGGVGTGGGSSGGGGGAQWLQDTATDYTPVDAGIGITVDAVDAGSGIIFTNGGLYMGGNSMQPSLAYSPFPWAQTGGFWTEGYLGAALNGYFGVGNLYSIQVVPGAAAFSNVVFEANRNVITGGLDTIFTDQNWDFGIVIGGGGTNFGIYNDAGVEEVWLSDVGAGTFSAVDAGAEAYAAKYCISGNGCITSWPSGGGGTNYWKQDSALDLTPTDAGIGITVAAVDAGGIFGASFIDIGPAYFATLFDDGGMFVAQNENVDAGVTALTFAGGSFSGSTVYGTGQGTFSGIDAGPGDVFAQAFCLPSGCVSSWDGGAGGGSVELWKQDSALDYIPVDAGPIQITVGAVDGGGNIWTNALEIGTTFPLSVATNSSLSGSLLNFIGTDTTGDMYALIGSGPTGFEFVNDGGVVVANVNSVGRAYFGSVDAGADLYATRIRAGATGIFSAGATNSVGTIQTFPMFIDSTTSPTGAVSVFANGIGSDTSGDLFFGAGIGSPNGFMFFNDGGINILDISAVNGAITPGNLPTLAKTLSLMGGTDGGDPTTGAVCVGNTVQLDAGDVLDIRSGVCPSTGPLVASVDVSGRGFFDGGLWVRGSSYLAGVFIDGGEYIAQSVQVDSGVSFLTQQSPAITTGVTCGLTYVIPETGNVYTHVNAQDLFSGTARFGGAWTLNGAIGYDAGSCATGGPGTVGPFSTTNYYAQTTSSPANPSASPYTIAVLFYGTLGASLQTLISATHLASPTTQYAVDLETSVTTGALLSTNPGNVGPTANNIGATWNLVLAGLDGSNGYIQLNNGALVTTARAFSAPVALKAYIGNNLASNQGATTAEISEVEVFSTTPSSGSFTSIYNTVAANLAVQGIYLGANTYSDGGISTYAISEPAQDAGMLIVGNVGGGGATNAELTVQGTQSLGAGGLICSWQDATTEVATVDSSGIYHGLAYEPYGASSAANADVISGNTSATPSHGAVQLGNQTVQTSGDVVQVINGELGVASEALVASIDAQGKLFTDAGDVDIGKHLQSHGATPTLAILASTPIAAVGSGTYITGTDVSGTVTIEFDGGFIGAASLPYDIVSVTLAKAMPDAGWWPSCETLSYNSAAGAPVENTSCSSLLVGCAQPSANDSTVFYMTIMRNLDALAAGQKTWIWDGGVNSCQFGYHVTGWSG